MITRIPAQDRHSEETDWLKTYWLFSFSDYFDSKNMEFGALRVFNDDVVSESAGFPDHPHANFEIITIVFEGELTHWDDSGNKGVIRRGDIQRMSAGSGIMHSEFNYGNAPVHLYQIWIKPEILDINPSYQKTHFDFDTCNGLVKLVSPDGEGGILIHSDSSLYYGSINPDQIVKFTPDSKRKVFIYVKSGELKINNQPLTQGDQARIEGEPTLIITAVKQTQFVLIDVSWI